MPHLEPSFETKDQIGRTKQFVGTVGTTSILLPSVTEGRIEEILIMCDIDNANTARLRFDLTGGTNFGDGLNKGAYIAWSIKGTPSIGAPIEQIRLVGNQANVKYTVIINFES